MNNTISFTDLENASDLATPSVEDSLIAAEERAARLQSRAQHAARLGRERVAVVSNQAQAVLNGYCLDDFAHLRVPTEHFVGAISRSYQTPSLKLDRLQQKSAEPSDFRQVMAEAAGTIYRAPTESVCILDLLHMEPGTPFYQFCIKRLRSRQAMFAWLACVSDALQLLAPSLSSDEAREWDKCIECFELDLGLDEPILQRWNSIRGVREPVTMVSLATAPSLEERIESTGCWR